MAQLTDRVDAGLLAAFVVGARAFTVSNETLRFFKTFVDGLAIFFITIFCLRGLLEA